jgi:ubiquinone/menaquinone biosynthesis C-methylase UbiE
MSSTFPRGEDETKQRSPTEILRDSEYHARFLQRTLAKRTDELARRMLAQEWHYLAALMPVPAEGASVLDLACGSGLHSLAWAERGARVTGIDFDLSLLEASRERLRRGAPSAPATGWIGGDATGMPFRTGSFDVVFCNSLLEHVPAWELVVAESARVLRPGGLFVVYTTNRTCPLQAEVNHFPFYSWLPNPIQRRVLAWIMEHRRDLVNWTDFPAVNWFTFPRMRRAFEHAGIRPLDRLDILAGSREPGRQAALARAATRVPALKWAYYFYAISMALYGVKR